MFNFVKNTKKIVDYNILNDDECRIIADTCISKNNNNQVIDKHVYKELEFFEDFEGKKEKTVFSRINMTDTFLGEMYLKKILTEPVVSYRKYKKYNINFLQSADKLIQSVKKNQKCLLSFLNPIESIYDNIYLPKIVLTKLNNDELRQMVQRYYMIFNIGLPFYTIFSPIIFLVIIYITKKILPKYFADKIKYIINITLMGLMNIDIFKINSFYTLVNTLFSLGFFVYNIYCSLKFSWISYILYENIRNKLIILIVIIGNVSSLFKIENLGIDTLEKINIKNIEKWDIGYSIFYKNIIKSPKLINYFKCIAKIDYILCKRKTY